VQALLATVSTIITPREAEASSIQMEKVAEPICKCYLSEEGRGLISCPFCGFGKVFDFKDETVWDRRASVQCKCGKAYEASFESRQHYRKRVKLSGEYTNLTARKSGRMIVEDISKAGIGFRVRGFENFRDNDLVKAVFELDNKKQSRILLMGEVVHVRGNFVGARILEIREGENDMGFFLMP
jgi:hypothetical protein